METPDNADADADVDAGVSVDDGQIDKLYGISVDSRHGRLGRVLVAVQKSDELLTSGLDNGETLCRLPIGNGMIR